MRVLDIAAVCHSANRELCLAMGDTSQPDWDDIERWQADSAVDGVNFALSKPWATLSAQHDAWMAEKVGTGWVYGPIKDAEKKEHPCLVPYDQLPPEQRVKDALFRAICAALSPLCEDPPDVEPDPRPVQQEGLLHQKMFTSEEVAEMNARVAADERRYFAEVLSRCTPPPGHRIVGHQLHRVD